MGREGGSRVRPHGEAHPGPTPHGETRPAAPMSRRMCFSVTLPPGRRGAQPPRQPAGHYEKWLNWANALAQPPARLRGGLRRGPAGVGLGPDCTEKRSLRVGPHGKAQCAWLLAYRMRLLVRRADRVRFSVRGYHQSALFRDPGYPECAFPLRLRPGGVGRNPPPACGALWKVAQLGKCVRATPRQAAGGVPPGSASLGLGP